MPIRHNGKVYTKGESIELEAKEAEVLKLEAAPKALTLDLDIEKLKAEADELGVGYASNIGAKNLADRIEARKAEIKVEADELGLEYTDQTDMKSLSEMIENKKAEIEAAKKGDEQ